VKHNQIVTADQLAGLAKQAREQAGRTRQEAANDFGVSWASVFQAEEEPQRSLMELRRRMLERYAGYALEGPLYRLLRRPGPKD
jgi:DNA-binding XRE family transcriptional regulator